MGDQKESKSSKAGVVMTPSVCFGVAQMSCCYGVNWDAWERKGAVGAEKRLGSKTPSELPGIAMWST